MEKKRTGSFVSNMSLSIVARVVTLVTGLVVQRYILLAYGSAINGLTASISQVMFYLVLLEAGLGTASIQALYSPLANNDWGKISGIFTATEKEYKKISYIFLALLFLVSVVLPLSVESEVEYKIAGVLTFVTGLSNILSYIFGGKYKAILNADRKMYVLYVLEIISSLVSCIFRVIALIYGANIVAVQLIHLGSIGIKNAGYVIYTKRNYKQIDYHKAPDRNAIQKRWNVLVHNIAGIVVNNTDIMVLTVFSSLKVVSIYSVYNLVFSQLSATLQTTFVQAAQGNFGRLYHKEKKAFEAAIGIYETVFTILLFVVCSIAGSMILPFVSVYTAGITDANYIDAALPVLFTVILLMNLLRVPAIITINVSGAFEETQKGAIIEAVINLSVSMVLFFFADLGLYGLLIGTVCSYAFRTLDVINYSYKHLIENSVFPLIRTTVISCIVMIALYYVFNIRYPITVTGYADWIIKAVITSCISGAAYLAAHLVFNRKEMGKIFGMLRTLVAR